jgi:hypothetical protein
VLNHISCLAGRVSSAAAVAAGQHELVDKVDNGAGRLIRIQFRKHVALVAAGLCRPARHKGKQPGRIGGRIAAIIRGGAFSDAPPAILRI